MEEIWKECRFDGYLISNLGRLKNVKTGYVSIGSKTNKGYRRITSTPKSYMIHRLVAEAFLDNPNNYKEVDHIDFNIENNNSGNLEWVSREVNIQRSFSNGNKSNKLTKNPMSKLSTDDMINIKSRYNGRRGDVKAKDLAIEFNVCMATIMKVYKKVII